MAKFCVGLFFSVPKFFKDFVLQIFTRLYGFGCCDNLKKIMTTGNVFLVVLALWKSTTATLRRSS